ncbi:omega-hydroxypalmitate O-feruloyl transferase [Selaginella moellendorffii]|uniref:omega-hydroxypalmitate O-feruloyl transferase n=1 Tax=Selaginella moellendorffii TaxID=88036 RepID=UPI000D1C4ED1|nr:omega-hydroxypalmitate O-feruloyl transferase [Selaginella moellendorffii]|eukprot:XP_024533907.1 omega-hydroxypalmitate O-feruloyl transferase [Selaginella moellendorffii]
MGAEATLTMPVDFKVELVKEPELVMPEQPVEEQHYFLSNLDQNIAVVMKTIYLFESSSARAADNPADVIRQGLSKALDHYYPLAGRLGISSEGKLEVVMKKSGDGAEQQGVVFAEAEADARICDLGDIIRPGSTPLLQLVYAIPGAKNVLEVPPMTVQVTKFKCGGFVLGLCINHCMFDGIGAMEFVHAWAELSRGFPLSLTPELDRSVLKARSPPLVEFPHLEYAQVDDVSGGSQQNLHLNDDDQLVYRVFRIRGQQLEQLKSQIDNEMVAAQEDNVDAPGWRKCSTFEALSALVWKCRTKALAMDDRQPSKLLFAVDYRSRIQPPLPKGFMGNGIMLTYAMTTASELESKHLSEVVSLVREAIARIHDSYIRSSIDCFELQRFCPSLFSTLLVSTWSRLSFHTTDFGWGEPLHSGPVGFSEPEVCLFLSHGRETKDMNLILGFRSDAMTRFHDELEQVLGQVLCST